MSKFRLMNSIPTSREEMERNMFVLAEVIKDGRLRIPSHLSHSVEGLARVRRLPNRRIDLLSISEMARLQANMMADPDIFTGGSPPHGERDTEPK
jgi:hypothetical protein